MRSLTDLARRVPRFALAAVALVALPVAGHAQAAKPSPRQQGAAARQDEARLQPVGDTTAAPTFVMREVYDYASGGRRDPFVSLLTTDDLRPTLTDLRLLGILFDPNGASVAALRDVTANEQRSVRVGAQLGRMRVTSIRPNVVVFTIEEFGMNRRDSLVLRDTTKVRP